MQKNFLIIRRDQSVALDFENVALDSPSLISAIFNCALMEKFNLSVCPAHEGGVFGEGVELVNLEPIGLRNNLNHFSDESKKVLDYYYALLYEFFCNGVSGWITPKLLLDANNQQHKHFTNSINLMKYTSRILFQVESNFETTKSFKERFSFPEFVFERLKKEMEPSLLSPYLTGI